MSEPAADRPEMPGYGILPATEGSGLIDWTEAVRRLTVSHDYWCATVRSDGAPHVGKDPAAPHRSQAHGGTLQRGRIGCTLTTDDAADPVVVEGVAEQVTDRSAIVPFLDAVNAKYDAGLTADFLDPTVNASFAVRPVRAFGLTHDDFPGSPTRWTFPER
jgi:hypothetical protein